jgi:hypothetical protein
MSNFSMITNDELACWVEVFAEENPEVTPEEIMSELTLINRLLVMQKNFVLLTRKRGLKTELDQIIGHHLGFKKEVNMNTKGR